MASLQNLVGRDLTDDEQKHIGNLQDEIDEIWSRRGDYVVEPDAWKKMPLFMESITEEDVATNANCAALAEIVYENVPPEELAENMKAQGNKAIQRVISGEQTVNPDNMCRAAVHCYTEGLDAGSKNATLNSQLYANRGMAHFLMQNFGHALQDSQKSILLNPNYTKAYFRGARCAERTRKWEIALNLIEKGLQTPKIDATAVKEFEELRDTVNQAQEDANKKVHSDKIKARTKAAQSVSMTRVLQGKGVNVVPRPEISSDQINQYTQGGKIKPYVDDVGVVHIPILFMYDEYDTTDFMNDVPTDCCMAEVLDDMMPFPFDAGQGRYQKMDDIICFYKVDDGVKMPEYHEFDLGWSLFEVMRTSTYVMPGMTPVFHIISRHSTELLKRYNLRQ